MLKVLRLLLLVQLVVIPLLLLQTKWRWSLLISKGVMTLIITPLPEPAVPASITIAAEAPSLS
jgi:hypothetical protein